MRSRARLLPAVVLGLLTGCVGAGTPLSEPKPSDADKPLLGEWRADRGDRNEYVEFAPPTAETPRTELGNQQLMVMADYKRREDGRVYAWKSRRAFVTAAGSKTFLNAYTERSKGAVPCPPREFDIPAWFEFYLYSLDGDTLTLWAMDDDATLKAARNGLIKGEEWPKGDPNPMGVAVEGGRPLLAFLTGKDGGGVFLDSGKVVFTRVKDKK
jgi:hypothetical protein